MNDSDIRKTINELAQLQAQMGAILSVISQSHLGLLRLVSELPDVPLQARSTILDSLSVAEPALEQFQAAILKLQAALPILK
jgi:hypothetical protein